MKTETKRNKVEASLVKYGNNPKDVAEMMAHFDAVLERYPNATPAKLTKVVAWEYAYSL